jgi:hypothetical protein
LPVPAELPSLTTPSLKFAMVLSFCELLAIRYNARLTGDFCWRLFCRAALKR